MNKVLIAIYPENNTQIEDKLLKNNYIENYEGFYASVIYGYFAGSGFDKIIAEDATSVGRIDLSIFIDERVYIFEFKVNQSGALAQIRSKDYHLKYMANYSEIYIIGVEFGILHNPQKQVDSSQLQNSKDNRIPLPPKVI